MTNPAYIDWAITNKCNLSCKFCTGLPMNELSHNEAIKLAEQIVELKPGWLIIEGGEPFMREDLKSILEVINSRVPTYIITNGNSVDEKFLHSLPPTKILISIDAASKEIYEEMRGGDFKRVMTTMQICAEMGILHGIIAVLTKRNLHKIRQLFELVKEISTKGGSSNIVFIPLMPASTPYYIENALTPLQQKEAIIAIYKYANDYEINAFYDEPFLWACGDLFGIDVNGKSESGITVNDLKGCAAGKSIYIEADGEVKYCMFSPANLRVGNVRKNRLKEIWETNILTSPIINEFRNREMRVGKCKTCVYFEICHGCIARISQLYGTHLQSDPACPLTK